MQLKSLFDLITAILESKENKILIISWLFTGSIIFYLYNNNVSLQIKLDTIEATYQTKFINLSNECENRLIENNKNNQIQINNYRAKSNMRSDSVENYLYNEIRKANQRFNQTIIKIQ
jgi:hypothetical protein